MPFRSILLGLAALVVTQFVADFPATLAQSSTTSATASSAVSSTTTAASTAASSVSASTTASSASSANATSTSTSASATSSATLEATLPQLCDESDSCTTYDGACVQLGNGTEAYIIVEEPTSSSVVLVGNAFNITWEYEDSNTTLYPAREVAIYYAMTASSSTSATIDVTAETYYSNLIAVVAKDATYYTWTPGSMQDGEYKLRVVADQIDPNYVALLDEFQCAFDGQPWPYTTNAFRIISPDTLVNQTDRFPPNSAAAPSPWRLSPCLLLSLLMPLFVSSGNGVLAAGSGPITWTAPHRDAADDAPSCLDAAAAPAAATAACSTTVKDPLQEGCHSTTAGAFADGPAPAAITAAVPHRGASASVARRALATTTRRLAAPSTVTAAVALPSIAAGSAAPRQRLTSQAGSEGADSDPDDDDDVLSDDGGAPLLANDTLPPTSRTPAPPAGVLSARRPAIPARIPPPHQTPAAAAPSSARLVSRTPRIPNHHHHPYQRSTRAPHSTLRPVPRRQDDDPDTGGSSSSSSASDMDIVIVRDDAGRVGKMAARGASASDPEVNDADRDESDEDDEEDDSDTDGGFVDCRPIVPAAAAPAARTRPAAPPAAVVTTLGAERSALPSPPPPAPPSQPLRPRTSATPRLPSLTSVSAAAAAADDPGSDMDCDSDASPASRTAAPAAAVAAAAVDPDTDADGVRVLLRCRPPASTAPAAATAMGSAARPLAVVGPCDVVFARRVATAAAAPGSSNAVSEQGALRQSFHFHRVFDEDASQAEG
ncbi:hypothetical protein HK405_009816 [Cladochytrium tenue]|nr:hypothetical protein HK405_009816 [Cladochytrium tenue]